MQPRDQDPTTQRPDAAGDPPAGDVPPTGAPGDTPTADAPRTDPPHEPPGDPPSTAPSGSAAGPPPPRRLYRSRDDRMLAGVCGGLAKYFGIDPVIVRVAAVALVFAGGAGLLAYLAGWLLVPDEGGAPGDGAGRAATIVGAVALVLAVAALVPFWGGPFDGWHWGGPFVSLIAIGLAGLVVWWIASGEHPSGSARDVLRRAGLGVALLALCGLLAIAGAWATAVGGGALVGIGVIVAGLWIAAAAFLGGARWLILPALALALPAGVVSAADIDVDGGVGEREYRPAVASQVRDGYRLGVGRMVVDLRDADLGPGERRLDINLGMGEAVVVVPPDVCVTSRADIGAGEVVAFGDDAGGMDLQWEDVRQAPGDTPHLVVDAEIGVGALHVGHEDPARVHGPPFRALDLLGGNDACTGRANG